MADAYKCQNCATVVERPRQCPDCGEQTMRPVQVPDGELEGDDGEQSTAASDAGEGTDEDEAADGGGLLARLKSLF